LLGKIIRDILVSLLLYTIGVQLLFYILLYYIVRPTSDKKKTKCIAVSYFR